MASRATGAVVGKVKAWPEICCWHTMQVCREWEELVLVIELEDERFETRVDGDRWGKDRGRVDS